MQFIIANCDDKGDEKQEHMTMLDVLGHDPCSSNILPSGSIRLKGGQVHALSHPPRSMNKFNHIVFHQTNV